MKRDILGRFISREKKESVTKYFKILIAILFVIGFTNGLISAADLVHDNVQKLKGSMVFASTKETQTINVSGMTVNEELQNLIETKTQEEMKSASNLKMYHDMVESEVNKQINILTATFK
jgi:hypothetical protein